MMKMNTKKIGILAILAVIVIAIVIAVVLIIGRIGAQRETPINEEAIIYPEEFRPEPGTVPAVHFSKLMPFLPDPPSGWIGEEPDGTTMTFNEGTWSTADRSYTEPITYASASISIIDGAYLPVGPWMMWEGFFGYETTDGYLKSTSFKGFPAWEGHTQPDHYTLHVNIDDRFMVSISASGVDKDTLYTFADKIDYRGIAALK